jgi:Ca2+-binding EF-hand superfamily protein
MAGNFDSRQIEAADVNNDGIVNVVDIIQIVQNILVGQEFMSEEQGQQIIDEVKKQIISSKSLRPKDKITPSIRTSSRNCQSGEVEIFGECYDINNTFELYFYNSQSTIGFEIPDGIFQLINLNYLWLHNGGFAGTIPESICDLPIDWSGSDQWGTNYFTIYDNNLCPPYPSCIENYIGYQDTTNCGPSLCNEEIEVEMWGRCYNIETTFSINGVPNEIPINQRYLPPQISELINLQSINLSNQNLRGEIPSEIGNLTNLYSLSLFGNQLTGTIPTEICNLTDNLMLLYLFNNKLCPPYPNCLSEQDIGVQDTTDCLLLGDVNQDGQVNVADVVMIVNDIISVDSILTEIQQQLADWNQDGQINVTDIVHIVQNIVGITSQQQSQIMNEVRRMLQTETQQTPIRQPRPAETKNDKQQLIDKILRKQR